MMNIAWPHYQICMQAFTYLTCSTEVGEGLVKQKHTWTLGGQTSAEVAHSKMVAFGSLSEASNQSEYCWLTSLTIQ